MDDDEGSQYVQEEEEEEEEEDNEDRFVQEEEEEKSWVGQTVSADNSSGSKPNIGSCRPTIKICQHCKGRDCIDVLRKFFEGLRKCNFYLVQEAIHAGVDVNIVNYKDDFPLLIAIYKRSSSIVELLLKSGAKVNMKENKEGITALHAACKIGHMRIIDLLLQNSADVNVQNNVGATPLHYACWRGKECVSIVEKMLKNHANANLADIDGQTPLMVASQLGLIEVVSILIGNGANIYMQDSTGMIALHYACIKPRNDNVAVIKSLLQHGSNVNSVDKENNTALHVACQTSDIKVQQIIQVLLTRGGNINARNSQGMTPLHFAVKCSSSLVVVDHLLENGADINALDVDGNSPLHLAAYYSRVCQMEKLIERGAIITFANCQNRTPYKLASHRAGDVCRPREIVAAHVMKLNLAGLPLFEPNYCPDHVTENLQLDIKKEFEKMKSFKVTECFSLDKIFAQLNIPYYLENKDIVDEVEKLLNSSDLNKQFPQFSYLLKNTFEQSKMRFKLIVKTSCLHIWNCDNVTLDYFAILKILRNLSNEDLINLIKSAHSH